MKRCRAPVPLEVIEYKGYYYSTIDFQAPDQHVSGTQTSYLPLRDGWELAPDEPDIVEAVVKPYYWAATGIVFANGKKYQTKRVEFPGLMRAQDSLLQGKSVGAVQGFKAKPDGVGDNRVLIRTLVMNHTVPNSASGACAPSAWKRRRFTDYKIVCEGEEIPCHREVLASCSPVFDRALDPHQYKEGCSNRYELKGSKVAVVKSMVEFMYTRSLPESVDLAELLCLADQYQVEDLVLSCVQILIERIGPQNIVAITRGVKGFKNQPKFAALWKDIQKKIKSDDRLLDLVMDYL